MEDLTKIELIVNDVRLKYEAHTDSTMRLSITAEENVTSMSNMMFQLMAKGDKYPAMAELQFAESINSGSYAHYRDIKIIMAIKYGISIQQMGAIFVNKKWKLAIHYSSFDNYPIDAIKTAFKKDYTTTSFWIHKMASANIRKNSIFNSIDYYAVTNRLIGLTDRIIIHANISNEINDTELKSIVNNDNLSSSCAYKILSRTELSKEEFVKGFLVCNILHSMLLTVDSMVPKSMNDQMIMFRIDYYSVEARPDGTLELILISGNPDIHGRLPDSTQFMIFPKYLIVGEEDKNIIASFEILAANNPCDILKTLTEIDGNFVSKILAIRTMLLSFPYFQDIYDAVIEYDVNTHVNIIPMIQPSLVSQPEIKDNIITIRFALEPVAFCDTTRTAKAFQRSQERFLSDKAIKVDPQNILVRDNKSKIYQVYKFTGSDIRMCLVNIRRSGGVLSDDNDDMQVLIAHSAAEALDHSPYDLSTARLLDGNLIITPLSDDDNIRQKYPKFPII